MDCNQRSFERGQSSRSTSRAKKIENQNTEDRAKRSPQYNRVRVEDLLNEEQAGTSDSSTSPNSKNVACTEEGCGKRFFTEKSLLVHQKRSHAAPTDFVCHLCQSSFSSIPNLNKHVSWNELRYIFVVQALVKQSRLELPSAVTWHLSWPSNWFLSAFPSTDPKRPWQSETSWMYALQSYLRV